MPHRNIVIYKGQTRPIPPMSMEGKGFVYKIALFPLKADIYETIYQISQIISVAQQEAFDIGGNAIIDAEIKDTLRDGNPYMREFSGTVVKLTKN